ncbi:hypothetical protein MUB24_19300 [Lederbergia sp. NSJ-179]|uniref:hypothetical protein n=1 Tax=Lederbergia sp. NSJ-179 TaxID=2931402 RepID=UPI001FD090BF|nr:hypothetical protein [Lederbergia sp. NSJ-179]MCJ7842984.1 hypothetical protein [Lederbergia sp. NSJ-179]
MKVKEAKTNAVEWIQTQACHEKGYGGAYFSGSIIGASDDTEISPSSDVDIVVVMEEEPPLKLGKFFYKGTLLEITYLSWNQLTSAQNVLTSYHLAGSFRVDTIIDDPTGQLRRLQTEVSQHYSEWTWVRRRCKNALQKVENGLRSIDAAAPFHEQVTAWMFPTGVTTHVILVAALKNPTVRKRYLAAREVLINYGHEALYDDLLELLGCAQITPEQVQHHLYELGRTFDQTVAVARTAFLFSTDITMETRPIAIDGSYALIETGNHREAVFWIIATFARCHTILAADSPDLHLEHLPTFQAAVRDLGITSFEDLTNRAKKVIQFLPTLWEVAEDILSKNPNIHH